MAPRILLAGGGTGGHLVPALNLARALREHEPGVELLYVGSERGLEARVLPERDLPYRLLPMLPIYRSRPWRNARWLARAGPVLMGLRRIYRSFDPVLAVGTGGYASGPPLLYGRITGRATALQEQNAEPGLVTRWMARWVDQVHLGFPEAAGRLRSGAGTRVLAYGNPVRPPGAPGGGGGHPAFRTGGRIVLVVGGSQGAAGLNRRLLEDLRSAESSPDEPWPEDVRLVWIAGRSHADALSAAVESLAAADRIRVLPYVDDLAGELDRVSLAVSRAGAMLVSELAAAGVPSVLVPFPGAAGGHQRANARQMAESGAALICEEDALAPGELWGRVTSILDDAPRRRRMARAARQRGRPDAAARTARALLRLAAGGPMTAERTAAAPAPETASPPDRSALPGPGGRIHLMGIGGAGMRGLALLLAEAGYRVSGCDRSGAPAAPELESRGIDLAGEHRPGHVEDVDLVVRSAAVPEDHPELAEARRRGVPAMKRARALGALVNGTRLVAVSGTHGKTTITAMAAHALRAAGRDPTVAVGGKAPGLDGYAAAGTGGLAVVEADEFDRSFLQLDPHLLVVSSLEPEHVESFGDFAAARDAYRTLARRAAPRVGVLYCADDEGARRLGRGLDGAVGYGRAEDAEYRLEEGGGGSARHALRSPHGGVGFTLPVPGAHNRLNAAAAFSAALLVGAAPEELEDALADFRGVERRLELLYESRELAVIDDYAHHPSEVIASVEAVRERFPDRTLVAVLQPHLFSRTRAFAPEFARALGRADVGLVLPIYPSREDPIPGVTSERIVEASPEGGGSLRLASPGEVTAPEELPAAGGAARAILFMGAGDVTGMARSLVRRLEAS